MSYRVEMKRRAALSRVALFVAYVLLICAAPCALYVAAMLGAMALGYMPAYETALLAGCAALAALVLGVASLGAGVVSIVNRVAL